MASGSGTVASSDINYSGSSPVALNSTGNLALGNGSNGGSTKITHFLEEVII